MSDDAYTIGEQRLWDESAARLIGAMTADPANYSKGWIELAEEAASGADALVTERRKRSQK